MPGPLHPAENRGYRELYATARHMANHWSRLAPAFANTPAEAPLADGAREAGELLKELSLLTSSHDLHGQGAAQGTGAALAFARSQLLNRGLERNQALRFALLDLEHLNTLLAYLLNVTSHRGDAELERFCEGWQNRLAPLNSKIREGIAELGGHADEAIEPLDSSVLGRAAHGAGWVIGTVGEASDRLGSRLRR